MTADKSVRHQTQNKIATFLSHHNASKVARYLPTIVVPALNRRADFVDNLKPEISVLNLNSKNVNRSILRSTFKCRIPEQSERRSH